MGFGCGLRIGGLGYNGVCNILAVWGFSVLWRLGCKISRMCDLFCLGFGCRASGLRLRGLKPRISSNLLGQQMLVKNDRV